MTVTIRIPKPTIPNVSRRRNRSKPKVRRPARARNQHQDGRFARIVKKLFFLFFLSIPLVTLLQTVFAKTAEYTITPRMPQETRETILSGPQWSYTVPFAVQNKADIEKLIQCESAGLNVSGPDSDGITSDGILQFHRGPSDGLDKSTWEDFSKASGIAGSPENPADAIRMADWAISHGLGPRWTCWRLQKLSP